jgi:hypothetical protein
MVQFSGRAMLLIYFHNSVVLGHLHAPGTSQKFAVNLCWLKMYSSTQPLTEMSTRNLSWGAQAAGAYGWQPYHLQVPIV